VRPTLRERVAYQRQQRSPWKGLDGLDRRLVAALPPGRGFFVEAGANDGLKQSNTYYLERRRRWTGLLVEPVPRLADECRRNRTATVVQAALVPPEMDGATIDLIDVDLMTIVGGAKGSTSADERHIRDGETTQGIGRQQVTAPGRALSSLLSDLGDPVVDLLSLDVEGFEVDALRGLDLERHAPAHILVETADVARVEEVLGGRYDNRGRLSHHDWLLVLR
jgi:FkbM family methyltransferase